MRTQAGKEGSSLVSSLVLVSGPGAPVTEDTSSPTSSSAEEDVETQLSSRLKVTSLATPYSDIAGWCSFPIQVSEPMWAPAAGVLVRIRPHCI